jgi:hypothetical protein
MPVHVHKSQSVINSQTHPGINVGKAEVSNPQSIDAVVSTRLKVHLNQLTKSEAHIRRAEI